MTKISTPQQGQLTALHINVKKYWLYQHYIILSQVFQAFNLQIYEPFFFLRYYDHLPKEIERYSNFADLWFYRRQIPTFFNNIISVFKKSKDSNQYIKMRPDQTRYLMVYLSIFEQAMNCVHKQYPSEVAISICFSWVNTKTFFL